MASLVRLQNAQARIAISIGTILAPAMEKPAGAMDRVAGFVTTMEAKHTLLSKALVCGVGGLGVAALGVAALGVGALGNAVVGIAGPILIARSLFGRLIPLAPTSAAGPWRRRWRPSEPAARRRSAASRAWRRPCEAWPPSRWWA